MYLFRGGGTTCFSNLSVWKTFESTVKEVEACPRPHNAQRRFNKFIKNKKRYLKKTKKYHL